MDVDKQILIVTNEDESFGRRKFSMFNGTTMTVINPNQIGDVFPNDYDLILLDDRCYNDNEQLFHYLGIGIGREKIKVF